EEESLVVANRSANAGSELVLTQRLLRRVVGVEKIAGVEKAVAFEAVYRPVKIVCPRLQSEVYDCTRLPSVFRRRMFLSIELLNRINWKNGSGSSLHAFGIDHGCAVVRIVVIGAVDYEVIVLGPVPVRAYREEPAACGPLNSGAQHHK